MVEGLKRDIKLLEIYEVSAWREQLGAVAIGLFTAGPEGLLAWLMTFRKLEGNWLPWPLIGVLAEPPLAYGQWRGVTWLQGLQAGATAEAAEDLAAAQSINEADRLARACAVAVRSGLGDNFVCNPLEGSELFCDRSYPTTVVITSPSFEPLQNHAVAGGPLWPRAPAPRSGWCAKPLPARDSAGGSRRASTASSSTGTAPTICAVKPKPASPALPINWAYATTALKNGPC